MSGEIFFAKARAQVGPQRKVIVLTCHKLRKVAKSLTENHITVFWYTFFELLLQITATMLVLAKLRNLAHKVFQARTRKPVDCAEVSASRPLME